MTDDVTDSQYDISPNMLPVPLFWLMLLKD